MLLALRARTPDNFGLFIGSPTVFKMIMEVIRSSRPIPTPVSTGGLLQPILDSSSGGSREVRATRVYIKPNLQG